MAGKQILPVSQTISSVSGGLAVVGTTAGFYAGALGYLAKSGQPGMTVKVVQVVSGTQLMLRQEVDTTGGAGLGASGGDIKPNVSYGFTDPTAYSGGTISLPAQLVYNSNEAPVT